MDRLRVLGKVVPEVGRVVGAGQVSFRVPLLRVDKVREFCWVSQEEDWSIVGDPVKVAFGCSELDREASRVTGRVGRSALTADGGESDSDGAFRSLLEHGGQAEVVHVVGADELAVSAGTLG